jgi:hypothetical protein
LEQQALAEPENQAELTSLREPKQSMNSIENDLLFRFLAADLDRLESHAPQLFHSLTPTKAMTRWNRILLKSKLLKSILIVWQLQYLHALNRIISFFSRIWQRKDGTDLQITSSARLDPTIINFGENS